jgi:hypothetical protein
MRKIVPTLSLLLAASMPALAQSEAPTPQQLMQQNDATIQNSTNALNRSLQQQETSRIEQEQRQQQLLNRGYENGAYPAYLRPVPPPPPPPPKPAQPSN